MSEQTKRPLSPHSSSSSSFATLDEALLTQDPQKLFFIINGESPILRSRSQQQRLLTMQQQFAAAQMSISTSLSNQPASLLSSLLLCVSKLVALVKTSVTHRKLEPAMRTSDLGLETHKQASLLLYATQAPGVSASILSASEFARLRLILTLGLVQLIEVKASWLEDATLYQKSIEQLQAFFKFAQGLDVDVYILYVRLLLRYSSSLLRHEASAALIVADFAKKQLQAHQKAIYAKSNLELTQQILKRGLAQGVAICIALVDEFCGDEHLQGLSSSSSSLSKSISKTLVNQQEAQSKSISLLPLYDAENKISFRDAFCQASNPRNFVDRPQFVAHVPEAHRPSVLRHVVCLYLAHVCWALLARGGSMEDIQSEFIKILRHLSSGSGNSMPKEAAQPMKGFLKSNLWELVFACFKTAMQDAPDPTAAAEIALSLHDATIEFITMHATSEPTEMKNLIQNVAYSSSSSSDTDSDMVMMEATSSYGGDIAKPIPKVFNPDYSLHLNSSSSSSCQSPTSPQTTFLTMSSFSSASHASTPKSLSADDILSSSSLLRSEDPQNCNNSSSSAAQYKKAAASELENAESACSSPLQDVLRDFDNLFSSSPTLTSDEAPPSPLLVSSSPCPIIVDESISDPESKHFKISSSPEIINNPVSRGIDFESNENSKQLTGPSSSLSSTVYKDNLPSLDWSYETGAEISSDEDDGLAQSRMEDERVEETFTPSHRSRVKDQEFVQSVLADFLIPPSNAVVESINDEHVSSGEEKLKHKKVRAPRPWPRSSDLLVESVRLNAESLASAAIQLGIVIVEDNILETNKECILSSSLSSSSRSSVDPCSTSPSTPDVSIVFCASVGRKRAPMEMSMEENDSSIARMTDIATVDGGRSFFSQQSALPSIRVDETEGGGKDGNKRRKPLESNDSDMTFDNSSSFRASESITNSTSGLNGLKPIRIPKVMTDFEVDDMDDKDLETSGLNGLAITGSAESTPLCANFENIGNLLEPSISKVDSSIRRVSSLSSGTSSRKKDRHCALIGGISTSRSLPLNVRWSDEVNAKEVMRRRERLVSLEEDYDASLIAFGFREVSDRKSVV